MGGCVSGSAPQEPRYIPVKILGKGTAEAVSFMHGRGDTRFRSHEQDPSCGLIHGNRHMVWTSRLS